MANTCVWIPKVKTAKGNRESKLYLDLLSYNSNDRRRALDMYFLIRGEDFQKRYKRYIKYDDAQEPILGSFLGKVDIKGLFNERENLANLTRVAGGIDADGNRIYLPDTAKNYVDLTRKADTLNSSGSFGDSYVAVVSNSEQGLCIEVKHATPENVELAKKAKFNAELNDKLRTILIKKGIDVENLYTLMESAKENGVVDYENAETVANGLIKLIRLADSRAGEEALPEEFAHFMLDVMRGEDPFVDRLFNMLDRNDLFKTILGDSYDAYVQEYTKNGELSEEDVRDQLIREAAGKMVAEALVNPQTEAAQKYPFFKQLLERIKSFIKRILDGKELNTAIAEARNAAYNVSTTILHADDAVTQEKLAKLKALPNLAQLAVQAKTAKQIIQNSIDKRLKTFTYYQESLLARIKKAETQEAKEDLQEKLKDFETRVQEYISKQQAHLSAQNFQLGVLEFIETASNDVKDCIARLQDIMSNGYLDNEVPFQLRNIRNILDSIFDCVKDISEVVHYPNSELQLDDATKAKLGELSEALNGANGAFLTEATGAFSQFLENYFPETGITYKRNGETVAIRKEDIKSLLKTADRDITYLDMWLNSAAETKDIIIKLSDTAIKRQKEAARQEVISIQKKLLAKAKILKQEKGAKAEEFIFEKHADGSLSSRYVSDTNWTAWHDSREEARKRIDEGIKEGQSSSWVRAQWAQWRKENCNNVGMPNSKYKNPNFQNGWSQAQKDYYEIFMEIRDRMIDYLPPDVYKPTDPMKAVQINKDLWERIKRTPLGQLPASMARESKQFFTGTSDSTDWGYVKLDFTGGKQLGVPIYFIKDVENEADLSRDATSTLIAFADMATNYGKMADIVDIFEVGKKVIATREAYQYRGSAKLREKLSGFGVNKNEPAVSSASNIIERYNHLLESQIYGKYMSDATMGKTDIKQSRVANFLVRWTSLNSLAFNGLAGGAAIINDMINIDNEALSGRQFTGKELAKADKEYIKYLPRVVGDIHNPIKSDKLSLFIEKFDVLHEYENDVRDIRWDTSKLKKLASSSTLYIFMQMGSHFGETRTAVAQAMHIKIKSDDGKQEKSLWDILKAEPIDPQHPENGSVLKVEDGFTLTGEDFFKYSRKFMALNQRLFGAYNKADRNMLQSTAVGQLAMLFRKFMIPAINRRFRGGDYNLELGEETEGFYVTLGRFIKDIATDSKHAGRAWSVYWGSLSDYEKSNCKKAGRELLAYAGLIGLSALLKSLDWGKKDSPWGKRIAYYLSRRAQTELGAFTPIGIFTEMLNLIKSPFPTMNLFEKIGDLIEVVFTPWNWFDEVKQGRYKGDTKLYKVFMELLPMNRTIYGLLHPEEKLIAFQ